MEIEKLSRKDFDGNHNPSIRVTWKGLFAINKSAVKLLKLEEKNGVSIGYDKKKINDFVIFKDDKEGWRIRKGWSGSMLFNSCGLAKHVIEATWRNGEGHQAGATMPRSVMFLVARVCVDDKNKDVYALIRKKI
jgi:hypothetical protein